jgi:hypothetical protein
MMNTVPSILLKRFRRIRPGGFLLAAAILLVFTDFFHFAFHETPSHSSLCAFSVPGGANGPDEAAAYPASTHYAGFCPVCEGILISDGPPPAQYGPAVLPYAADPIFSGIDSYKSLSFLLPQGRAPPRAA